MHRNRMRTSLMIDNWTLQDVESVLTNGLPSRMAGEIAISADRQSHSFGRLPEAVIQIDALLTLLTNVVCFDTLSVDSRFLHTWQRDDAQLLPLANLGVVVPEDYADLSTDLNLLREALLGELCVTPTLKSDMATARGLEKRRSAGQPALICACVGRCWHAGEEQPYRNTIFRPPLPTTPCPGDPPVPSAAKRRHDSNQLSAG